MLGMALDPDYDENGWVYIGYVHPLGDGSTKDTPAMTRVIRGRVDGHRWADQEDIFRLPDELHFARGMRWGCRLFFDKDGFLYFSIGDIGRNDEVQLISKPGGKLYRIHPDGSIPEDNPYVGWRAPSKRSTPSAIGICKASISIPSPAKFGPLSTGPWVATNSTSSRKARIMAGR